MVKSWLAGTSMLAMMFASSQAFAQAKNFEGFSVGANLNLYSTSFDRTASGTTSTATATDQNAGLFAVYSMALGEKFVLGLGVTYGLNSYKIGSIGTSDFTIKENNSFDVIPGYAVSDTTMIFTKISAANAKSASSTGTNTIDNSGTSYGIGARMNLTKNVYAQVEYIKHNFPEKVYPGVTYSPTKQDQYSFGVAYKF